MTNGKCSTFATIDDTCKIMTLLMLTLGVTIFTIIISARHIFCDVNSTIATGGSQGSDSRIGVKAAMRSLTSFNRNKSKS